MKTIHHWTTYGLISGLAVGQFFPQPITYCKAECDLQNPLQLNNPPAVVSDYRQSRMYAAGIGAIVGLTFGVTLYLLETLHAFFFDQINDIRENNHYL